MHEIQHTPGCHALENDGRLANLIKDGLTHGLTPSDLLAGQSAYFICLGEGWWLASDPFVASEVRKKRGNKWTPGSGNGMYVRSLTLHVGYDGEIIRQRICDDRT